NHPKTAYLLTWSATRPMQAKLINNHRYVVHTIGGNVSTQQAVILRLVDFFYLPVPPQVMMRVKYFLSGVPS
ncbi:MAG: hypothetical protein NZ703_06710, partial [Gemmataceae bacterium]|nr:hypothetical protein [Gemmataceae bacterium]